MSNSIEKELHLQFLDRRLTNTASRLAWNSLVGNEHNEAKINLKTQSPNVSATPIGQMGLKMG